MSQTMNDLRWELEKLHDLNTKKTDRCLKRRCCRYSSMASWYSGSFKEVEVTWRSKPHIGGRKNDRKTIQKNLSQFTTFSNIFSN